MRMADYTTDYDAVLGGEALDRFIGGLDDRRSVAGSLDEALELVGYGHYPACPPASLPEGTDASRMVTFLVDQSGSQRHGPNRIIMEFLDAAARKLESEGIPFEVIGHTTPKWKGGDTFEEWVADGRPAPAEGTFWRLNEVLTMVHKAAHEPWDPVGRGRVEATLVRHTDVLKENIDQVALAEAILRQRRMGAPEGTVVIVGDLYPVDDWTIMHGPKAPESLADDLARVIADARREGANLVGVECYDQGAEDAAAARAETLGIPVLALPREVVGRSERIAALVEGELADLALGGKGAPCP